MITRLVVNGCSYMYSYTKGGGHNDLANRLNISVAKSLTVPGSCNSRIIRTTLKDSYQTTEPTLYIVGLSFLGRSEFPIHHDTDEFEGRWTSIQNSVIPCARYLDHWTKKDTEKFIEIKLKLESHGLEDYVENFQYQLLSMINDLKYRGHQVVVFRLPADVIDQVLSLKKFDKLRECVNIVDGLQWKGLLWQYENGVNPDPADEHLPLDIRHPLPGEHGPLNNFLFEYLNKHALYLSVL